MTEEAVSSSLILSSEYAVGETVRATPPSTDCPTKALRRCRRRATIATIEDGCALLLWEDEAPWSIISSSNRPAGALKKKFLVAPSFAKQHVVIESTAVLLLRDLCPILDFERKGGCCCCYPIVDTGCSSSACISGNQLDAVELWKGRGDALLRLGDAAAALSFYEVALMMSSSIQIGGSVLLLMGGGGNVVVGEVDCINEEEGSVDITLAESGEERTVKGSEVKLCVLEDDKECLQERVLLNISRCLLRLAETTESLARRPHYLRSAYVGCTLALSIESMLQNGSDKCNVVSSTAATALLLRCQAYTKLNKYPYAIADMKRLLVLDPHHKEANRRLANLERQKDEQARTDKRLAKEVCKWVEQATTTSESSSVNAIDQSSIEERTLAKQTVRDVERIPTKNLDGYMIVWISLVMAVLLAWIFRHGSL
jgi:tetratricopeptide (TPR) repeat protein